MVLHAIGWGMRAPGFRLSVQAVQRSSGPASNDQQQTGKQSFYGVTPSVGTVRHLVQRLILQFGIAFCSLAIAASVIGVPERLRSSRLVSPLRWTGPTSVIRVRVRDQGRGQAQIPSQCGDVKQRPAR